MHLALSPAPVNLFQFMLIMLSLFGRKGRRLGPSPRGVVSCFGRAQAGGSRWHDGGPPSVHRTERDFSGLYSDPMAMSAGSETTLHQFAEV